MREQRSSRGNRLEAAGSPAAVQKNALDRRRPDDGRRVRNDIDDPAPLAHQLQLAEGWDHLEQAGENKFLHRWGAAAATGRNGVETAAEYDLALVRRACADGRA